MKALSFSKKVLPWQSCMIKQILCDLVGSIIKENLTNIYKISLLYVLINVNSKPMELYISVVVINKLI
jgi:hypothetical protein